MSPFSETPAAGLNARILVVDDDTAIRAQLAEGLALDGHKIFPAEDVSAARGRLRSSAVDLVLLDVNLPGISGYTLLRDIRAGSAGALNHDRRIPVILLSGRTDEVDRVRGFELGCDDYVPKPYSFTELRGRIAAVLRRMHPVGATDRTIVGDLAIDRRSRAVWVDGERVHLTSKEYALLVALAEDPLRVFTREELLSSVWGYTDGGNSRTLDAHACRLRAKLSGRGRRYVVNLWSVGYRLIDGGVADAEAAR